VFVGSCPHLQRRAHCESCTLRRQTPTATKDVPREGIGAQGKVVAANELGTEQLEEEPTAHAGRGSRRRKHTSRVQDVEPAVLPAMALCVSCDAKGVNG
jgi:hypothetical protein